MIGPELTTVFALAAAAGLALLFARDWTLRLTGALLLLPRLLAAPLADGEVIIFGCAVAAAVGHAVYARTFAPREPADEADGATEAPDPPGADDTSEPTVCVACRGPIPAGTDTCPGCGWSYTALS